MLSLLPCSYGDLPTLLVHIRDRCPEVQRAEEDVKVLQVQHVKLVSASFGTFFARSSHSLCVKACPTCVEEGESEPAMLLDKPTVRSHQYVFIRLSVKRSLTPIPDRERIHGGIATLIGPSWTITKVGDTFKDLDERDGLEKYFCLFCHRKQG